MRWMGGGKRGLKAKDSVDHRAFHRRRRRRRLKQGAVLCALLGLLGGAGYGGYVGAGWSWDWVCANTNLTRIREVNAKTTHWIPQWEVVELSGLVPGDDLFTVNLEQAQELLEAHPRIASAKVIRRLWDRSIVIKVDEYRPLAVILDGDVEEVALGGIALGKKTTDPLRRGSVRGPELPLLTGRACSRAPVGVPMEDRGIQRALAFLALLEEYGLPGYQWISEICVDDPESLVVFLLEGGTPIRIGKGRISHAKMQAFFAVLEDLTEKGIHPAGIDIRFANQIVVQDS